jgi:hypothetical protein
MLLFHRTSLFSLNVNNITIDELYVVKRSGAV